MTLGSKQEKKIETGAVNLRTHNSVARQILSTVALHLGENYLHITKSILLKTWHSVECCIALKVFLIMYAISGYAFYIFFSFS